MLLENLTSFDWLVISLGVAPTLLVSAGLLVVREIPPTRLFVLIGWQSRLLPLVMMATFLRLVIWGSTAFFVFGIAFFSGLLVMFFTLVVFLLSTKAQRAAFTAAVERGEAVRPVVNVVTGAVYPAGVPTEYVGVRDGDGNEKLLVAGIVVVLLPVFATLQAAAQLLLHGTDSVAFVSRMWPAALLWLGLCGLAPAAAPFFIGDASSIRRVGLACGAVSLLSIAGLFWLWSQSRLQPSLLLVGAVMAGTGQALPLAAGRLFGGRRRV